MRVMESFGRWICRRAALLVVAGGAAAGLGGGPAPVVRDWAHNPAVVQVQTSEVIYELADVHGDYDKAVKLLVGAGLMAGVPARLQEPRWAGGKSILVCTGDMIDKWSEGLEVIRLLRAMQADAKKAGGQVIVTLGNHEAEFLAAGGANAKGAKFEAELRAAGIDPVVLAAGHDSEGIGQWLRNRPVAVKVNDWFFCHAGNTFGMTLAELESGVEKGVMRDGFGATILAEPNSILEARLAPVPWWMTAPATAKDGVAQDPAEAPGLVRLRGYIEALGCKHLVIGHQPGKAHLGAHAERAAGQPFAYEGLLFLADTGMSRGAQDARGVVLRIHPGTSERVEVVDANGVSSLLWSEK